jgi:hypothetical protein
MVIRIPNRPARRRGVLMVELLVALALLTAAILPLAYSIASEKRYVHAAYQRALAMELVDGEIEVLAAGGWRAFTNGTTEYSVQAVAATNLPPGRFLLILEPAKVRLEWHPAVKQHGGSVVREVNLK